MNSACCLLAALSHALEGLVTAVDANHGLTKVRGDLCEDGRVVVVCDSLHDGTSTRSRVAALENARPDEDAVHAHLHHESGISWGGDSASSEVDDWQTAQGLDLADQLHRGADLFRVNVELVVIHGLKSPDCAHDGAAVTDSLHHVPGASFSLYSKKYSPHSAEEREH